MKNKLINFVTEKPLLTIAASVILSLALASGIFRLTVDDDMINLLPKHMDSRKALDRFEDTFGRADFVMMGIGVKKGTIFNRDTLERIHYITERMKDIPGIDKVDSLSTLNRIKGEEWGLEVKPFMEEVPGTQEEINRLEGDVFEDDTFVGTFVSEDKRYTTIIGTTLPRASEVAVYKQVKELQKEVEGTAGVDEVFLTGMPVIRSYFGLAIVNDLRKFLPLVFLVLSIILYLSIRTVRGVAMTIALIGLSVLPMMGVMGYLGKPLMAINNAMPVILLALACADSIHIITRFYLHCSSGMERKEAVKKTMSEMTLPVVVTSITTMAGFISLIAAPVPKLGEMGLFISFGVFWALALSLTFLPAMLAVSRVPQGAVKKIRDGGFIYSFLEWLSGVVVKHKMYIMAISAVMLIISIVGILRINIETNPTAWVSRNSEIKIATDAADEHFGGAISLSLLLEGDIKKPELLNAMSEFQDNLKGVPEVGKSFSIADVVKRINKAINDNDEAYKVIPKTREKVAQALLLYSFSGDPDDFEKMVNNSYSQAALNIRIGSFNTKLVVGVVNKINAIYGKIFPPGTRISATGTAMFITELADLIIRSTIISMLVALMAVTIINGIAYRSAKIGLLSSIPLAVAVLLNFGVMGLAGIALSLPLAVISSIAIGVGVDYAVHYSASYKEASKTISDPDEKTRAIFHSVCRPILYNAVSVAAGFLVLLSSEFVPLKYFGFLVSLSMAVCALGTLTVLAASLNIFNPAVINGRQ